MSLLGMHARNHPQQLLPVGDAHDGVDDRATHPLHFEMFVERFGEFTVDVAAAAHNTKCTRFYDRQTNGLRQSWAGELVWCNPPYSAIEPWVIKAWQEAPTTRGIVMLLPANRTEQKWWQRHVEPHRDQGGGLASSRRVPARSDALHQGRRARHQPQRPAAVRVLPADLARR